MFKKAIVILLSVGCVMSTLIACGGAQELPNANSKQEEQKKEETKKEAITIKVSPDKYTWYVKDYIGKNLATVGYTSMGGDRIDTYGEGYIELGIINSNGSYIDISNKDELKKYVIAGQNLEPNTEIKYTFRKDEEGNEYDNLVESQSVEEILLWVKEVGTSESEGMELTAIQTSPDKYTYYIKDYVGRNLQSFGYISMGGDFRDTYGESNIKLVLVPDDGSFLELEDESVLQNYVVTGQSIAPNTELKYEYLKDNEGNEYDNLVDSQNIEEIELRVSLVE